MLVSTKAVLELARDGFCDPSIRVNRNRFSKWDNNFSTFWIFPETIVPAWIFLETIVPAHRGESAPTLTGDATVGGYIIAPSYRK
jgi:hypothetical protein